MKPVVKVCRKFEYGESFFVCMWGHGFFDLFHGHVCVRVCLSGHLISVTHWYKIHERDENGCEGECGVELLGWWAWRPAQRGWNWGRVWTPTWCQTSNLSKPPNRETDRERERGREGEREREWDGGSGVMAVAPFCLWLTNGALFSGLI